MRTVLKAVVLGIVVPVWLFMAVALPQIVGESAELEHILAQMDAAARNFKATEASVVWDHYDRVIKETETERGKIYFRRDGGKVQMAVDFANPEKYVRYSGGKVQVYLPKMDEVDEYTPGKNRSEVESYLVLGFGGSGHDLLKSYDVKFLGPDTVDGIKAEELQLIPKSDRVRNDFIARILLWIDPARGVSVQQQFFEPGGNYRLVKYSDIQSREQLPQEVFKLKTTKKTKFVSPQG
ncbi:MAG: outer membrane lipoprotein carrier protein LolA [Terriglobales bacterium]